MSKHIVSGYKIMNNTISIKKSTYAYVAFFVASLMLLAGLMFMAQSAHAAAFASIGGTMGVGSRGTDVRNLQTFLASDHNIYPEAMVTGYYGNFTKAAVTQFQVNYALPQIGIVNSSTLARMNTVISAGNGIDIYAPTIYNVSVQATNSGATFNWTTTENAGGKVFYSTSPLNTVEATGPFMEPSITGGLNVATINSQSSQAITVANLQAHTTYYYIIEAQDASGNVSVTVQSSFTTNQ